MTWLMARFLKLAETRVIATTVLGWAILTSVRTMVSVSKVRAGTLAYAMTFTLVTSAKKYARHHAKRIRATRAPAPLLAIHIL